VIVHNTFINSGASQAAVSMDGPGLGAVRHGREHPLSRDYGLFGSGSSDGISSLNIYAPGYEFLNNAIIDGARRGAAARRYPATTPARRRSVA
jgi:hypothetical protein